MVYEKYPQAGVGFVLRAGPGASVGTTFENQAMVTSRSTRTSDTPSIPNAQGGSTSKPGN